MSFGKPSPPRASTGVPGLDHVLLGGFPAGHVYLIEGTPGSGKTTLGLQFLMEGVSLAEPGFYVTLSETEKELAAIAESHSWSLEGITLHEMETNGFRVEENDENTVFPPDEVELGETINRIQDEVKRLQPRRVVIDSLSELRLMAREPFRYRRRILALKHFFAKYNCTVLLLDDQTKQNSDVQLQSIAHGVLQLQRLEQPYGASRRQINVLKMRGSDFRDGLHDYVISEGGLTVFPRLVAAEHREWPLPQRAPSNVAELDTLLGGGLDRGASALIMGPAGVGKSALAIQYAKSFLERGEPVACFLFEDSAERFLRRASGFGYDMNSHLGKKLLTIRQIDPAELSPGEFAAAVRASAEQRNARMVLIDSLNGYFNAMPNEKFLLLQMHELLMYLNQKGALTLLTLAQHGLLAQVQSPVDLSYLTDALILLRYFEAQGEVRQAISVLKHRDAAHERTIREFQLTAHGIRIGKPLSDFRGVLCGNPVYGGLGDSLLTAEDNGQ